MIKNIKNKDVIIEELNINGKAPNKVPDNAPIPFLQLDQGVDVLQRVIYLTDIDILTPAYIQQRADTIYQMSGDNSAPITIVITSYGGEVYGMFGAVDVIKQLPSPVNTYGVGTVQSAATTILACGTGKRTLAKNSIVMLHQISSWVGGQTDDMANELKHTQELQSMLYDLLGARTKRNAKFWEKNTTKNLYLPAKKCLEYGLVDGIV